MQQRTVRTAVIPAAGFGTRMLPATRAVPKELLPVGRKPAIEWVIEEATQAGIDWFVVVSSPRKPAIDAYLLGRDDPSDPMAWPRATEVRGGNIELIHQPMARGLGDAVRLAHSILGAEPFALLLPDELLLGGSRLLATMLEDYSQTGMSSVSLLEVPQSEIKAYGCARVASSMFGDDERLFVTGCVEKPDPFNAPSSLALSGRYVLGCDALDLLDDVEPDARGEVQLTPALDRAARIKGLAGFLVQDADGRVDVGNWDGWFDANTRAFESEQLLTVASPTHR